MMAHFKQNQVILIDFGLTLNQNATEKRAEYSFKGTPYFASNNQLQRGKLGPADDIESLIYVLIYLHNGSLPWAKNVPVLGEELQAQLEVRHVIAQRDPETLCANLDTEFITILTYIYSCSSKKRPDYRYIKKNLLAIKERHGFQGILEWFKPEMVPSRLMPAPTDLEGSVGTPGGALAHSGVNSLQNNTQNIVNSEGLLPNSNDESLTPQAVGRLMFQNQKEGAPSERIAEDKSNNLMIMKNQNTAQTSIKKQVSAGKAGKKKVKILPGASIDH